MYGGRVRVPIRVIQQETSKPRTATAVENAAPPVVECVKAEPPSEPGEAAEPTHQEGEELEMWRDRALRLEAEMVNFRKRQQRMAEITVAEDRERLLLNVLRVADDLDRALAASDSNPQSLREGLSITRQTMAQLLALEGVTAVPAQGESFDPNWHEAVGTRPCQEVGTEPGAIVEVVAPGYQLGQRLLRPARVIVAAE